MKERMQAVIMAGGRGTRLYALTKDEMPKPMVPIQGKPILQWQIECLKANGITDICIIIGHIGEKIQEYFGNGKSFGITIQYFHEKFPLGTAGALAYISFFLSTKDFLLIFGDTIFNINIDRMVFFHKEMNADITLFVHPNSHPFDSDLVILDKNQKVIGFDTKNNIRNYWYNNIVNAGLYILSPNIVKCINQGSKTDFEKDIVVRNIKNYNIYGYLSTEYIKDAGTIDRIRQVEVDINKGIVSLKNLTNKQACIFLDRDGTINKESGFIYKLEDFILEPFAIEAIKKINASPYLAIVVTNQPSVARGLCNIEDIKEIHKKLCTLLGKGGAYLDKIMFCPHHPDRGYPGENLPYKIECQCRKPGTEMITRCIKDFNIDITKSWIVGDTTTDIQTGKNAGLKTILVKTGMAGNDKKYPVLPDMVCESLLDAVDYILQGKQ
jgi:histidinol-phosphate phosphatase family protein